MEETFTVEEAASILDCDRSTVYELRADGWLRRPTGGSKKETGGRVTRKSLYQFVIVDRLSQVPVRVLKELRNSRKLFEKSASKISGAKRLSRVEGEGEVAGALNPAGSAQETSTGLRAPPTEQEPRRHHDFAEQHQFSFGWRARQLAPGDRSLQDDLVQEMSLAVLEYDQPASSEYLFELAVNHAIDYLRYEAARGKLSLSQVREPRDKLAEKMASLHTFIDGLLQRGVPTEWIEEVIGWRMNPA